MTIYSNRKRSLVIIYTVFVLFVSTQVVQRLCVTQKRCINFHPNELSLSYFLTTNMNGLFALNGSADGRFELQPTLQNSVNPRFFQANPSALWDAISRLHTSTDSHFFAKKIPLYTLITTPWVRVSSVLSGQWCKETLFSCLRTSHRQFITRYLEFNTAQIIVSLWYGSSQATGSETALTARNSGLSHLFAPSGLHLNSSIATISALSGLLIAKKKLITMHIMGVILFVGLVGVLPSLLRAGVYHILGYLYALSGRSVSSVVRLLHSVLITLIFLPGMLLSVGYQLSVVATLGLILIAPVTPSVSRYFLDSFSTRDLGLGSSGSSSGLLNHVARYFLEMSLIGVTAQLVTLPLVWYYFNQIQPFGILFSLVFLWLVPILVQFLVWSLLTSLLSTAFSVMVVDHGIMAVHVLLFQPLLEYVSFFLSYFSNFFDPLSLPEISWLQVIGLYLVIGMLFGILRLSLQRVSHA